MGCGSVKFAADLKTAQQVLRLDSGLLSHGELWICQQDVLFFPPSWLTKMNEKMDFLRGLR
eukprot:484335-Pelagomonas_calceolata.AAC.1